MLAAECELLFLISDHGYVRDRSVSKKAIERRGSLFLLGCVFLVGLQQYIDVRNAVWYVSIYVRRDRKKRKTEIECGAKRFTQRIDHQILICVS